MSQTYRIKPLEWRDGVAHGLLGVYLIGKPVDGQYVLCTSWGGMLDQLTSWRSSNRAELEAAAEEHHRATVTPWLEEAK